MQFLFNKFHEQVILEKGSMSNAMVAEQTGLDKATIQRVVTGKTQIPDLITYVRLCSWMKVSLNKFIDIPTEEKVKSILEEFIKSASMMGTIPKSQGETLLKRIQNL